MAIKLINITKKFDQFVIFEQYSNHINLGKTTCIMGASGSGKTTLLRIMLGLETIDDGRLEGLQQLKKSVVFQEDRLCENLTVAANIKLARKKPLEISRIKAAISQVDLPEDCLMKAVKTLSGGQKRRVAILRAILADYDILFMDEPFKGLDLETKNAVMAYVKEMTKGKTVVLVTHDKKEYELLGHHLINLSEDDFGD